MISFERVSNFKRFFFGFGILFLLLGILFFFTSKFHEVLIHNYTNDIRGTIFMVVSFLLSLIFFLAGFTLRAIAYDTVEELNSIQAEIKTIRKTMETLNPDHQK